MDHWPIHYLVCDEVQFYTPEQCDQLARVVDELEVEVYAFGLITDFRGRLFEGTQRMLEIADERVPLQVEARCWCGARATHNARVVNGEVVNEGETIVVGDTDDPTTRPCSATPSATSSSAAATSTTASSAADLDQTSDGVAGGVAQDVVGDPLAGPGEAVLQ